MIICLCHALSEQDIKQTAKCSKNHKEALRKCEAGKSCGMCRPDVKKLIEETLEEHPKKAVGI